MNKRAGFSLLELLITLGILVVVIGFSLPRFSFFTNIILNHELDRLFMVCSYLQQKAIATHQPQTLSFDIQNNQYSYLHHNKPHTFNLSGSLKFGSLPKTKGPPAWPKNIVKTPVTFQPAQKAVFFPDGKVSPGTVYIVDKGQKIMGALTCAISEVCYIRKYRYNNNQWQLVPTGKKTYHDKVATPRSAQFDNRPGYHVADGAKQ
ncbi:type II secretion system GspH family protein [Candidatus Babeliales bacterium]|nr:type II secretion system GspH family protein [Candidatus Babeliales bacterium]